MFLIEDLCPLLGLDYVAGKTRLFSESVLQSLHETVTSSSCESSEIELCRDESAAFVLKFAAIASILIAGMGGISIPLIGKHRIDKDNIFVGAKAFAAGVILATGFVHMLTDSSKALNNPCLESYTWSKFPFSGFFAMMSALLILLVDLLATRYYEGKGSSNKVSEGQGRVVDINVVVGDESLELLDGETGIVPVVEVREGVVGNEENGGMMHIVGSDDEGRSARHVIVSQVLELGIVSHSVIIGLSLGVSQSPCTIRPLIAALSFHQFFEGFALGGCISQAQFKTSSATIMACFFALTTPIGIGIGTSIASIFNPYSPGALIIEGILDSLSAGVLVYMALVDLIAADFHSKRMSCNFRLQIVSFCLLFLGAGMMSLLAIWV